VSEERRLRRWPATRGFGSGGGAIIIVPSQGGRLPACSLPPRAGAPLTNGRRWEGWRVSTARSAGRIPGTSAAIAPTGRRALTTSGWARARPANSAKSAGASDGTETAASPMAAPQTGHPSPPGRGSNVDSLFVPVTSQDLARFAKEVRRLAGRGEPPLYPYFKVLLEAVYPASSPGCTSSSGCSSATSAAPTYTAQCSPSPAASSATADSGAQSERVLRPGGTRSPASVRNLLLLAA
jgi:hypothetical protein